MCNMEEKGQWLSSPHHVLGFLLVVNNKINFGWMLREGSLSSQQPVGAGPAAEDLAGCSSPGPWAGLLLNV